MTRARAIRIAVAALEAERQRLAVNANMYERLGLDTPATRGAATRRAELAAAMAILQQPEQTRMV